MLASHTLKIRTLLKKSKSIKFWAVYKTLICTTGLTLTANVALYSFINFMVEFQASHLPKDWEEVTRIELLGMIQEDQSF